MHKRNETYGFFLKIVCYLVRSLVIREFSLKIPGLFFRLVALASVAVDFFCEVSLACEF